MRVAAWSTGTPTEIGAVTMGRQELTVRETHPK
jgi:hypothetical protein